MAHFKKTVDTITANPQKSISPMPNTTKSTTTNSPATMAPYPSSIIMSVQKRSPRKTSRKEDTIKKDGPMHPADSLPSPTVSIINVKELPSPAAASASTQMIPISLNIP